MTRVTGGDWGDSGDWSDQGNQDDQLTRVTGLTTDAIQGCSLKVELMVASNQDIKNNLPKEN